MRLMSHAGIKAAQQAVMELRASTRQLYLREGDAKIWLHR